MHLCATCTGPQSGWRSGISQSLSHNRNTAGLGNDRHANSRGWPTLVHVSKGRGTVVASYSLVEQAWTARGGDFRQSTTWHGQRGCMRWKGTLLASKHQTKDVLKPTGDDHDQQHHCRPAEHRPRRHHACAQPDAPSGGQDEVQAGWATAIQGGDPPGTQPLHFNCQHQHYKCMHRSWPMNRDETCRENPWTAAA